MKTEHEYETFGPEWRASLKGMSKAHIIELFSKVGKEKEKLEDINAELLEALKAAHQVILVLSEDTNTALVKQIENVISKTE